ncbi:MAG: putative metal-binding motif-containing protein [Acidobacteria bacterium]|nr:putative metal-binding motif-containing protein [Acidobacteriota bacterium]
MTPAGCDDYLADPDAHPGHLETCDACRKAAAGLNAASIEAKRDVVPPSLPLAPWEGARQRSWSTAIAVALAVALVGGLAFIVIGVSPLEGFLAAVASGLPGDGAEKVIGAIPDLLAGASRRAHILIFAAFVVVNVIFVALLRRRTRGYDVRPR